MVSQRRLRRGVYTPREERRVLAWEARQDMELRRRGVLPPRARAPSPGVAALLSFFFAGAGLIYCGRLGKGLSVMLFQAGLGFALLSSLIELGRLEASGRTWSTGQMVWAWILVGLSFLLWISQLVYAYRLAEAINDGDDDP